ncbi:MAG: VOC family protein [Flavobacteriales bacterium]|nr:VOC family protein [Flavobacteriales bacterium]
MKQKITPFLWATSDAKEMADYYLSIFSDGKIVEQNGFIFILEIAGQQLGILNGGPHHIQFDDSISLMIDCEDQQEVDFYWEKFTANGGQESMCGWCKDKYGVSWQVVPRGLKELLSNPDREKAQKATQAMLKMQKIDLKKMEEAASS